jgi:diamine N-acetyltransferase
VRGRPGADALYTSAVPEPGSPQPFYKRYGFVATGEIVDDEVVLRLDLGR